MSEVSTIQHEQNENFTNIPLSQGDDQYKKKKKPRKILHFSDGILEEYSTDEDEVDNTPKEPPVNPKTLSWLPWIWYYITIASSKTLSAADLCGEKLAWFFGITSPKYQYAIDEYYRLKEEEEKEKKRLEQQQIEVSAIDVKVVADHKENSTSSEPPQKY